MEHLYGDKIRYAREFREMDRTTFAKKLGVKYRDVLRWETTSHTPRPSMLKKMADILMIDINYFFDEDNDSSDLISYIPEEELIRITDLADILVTRRKQTKECIDKINDLNLLKTTGSIMIDLVEPKLLIPLCDVLTELSHYQFEENIYSKNDDEKRIYIKKLFYLTTDIETLRKLLKIVVPFTALKYATKQTGLLQQITDSFPKYVMPNRSDTENE